MQASDFFQPGGALSKRAGFEFREGQAEMADRVQDVLKAGGALMVEAGTGIGKSYAYLIPALLSGERVVVSTATKNLQDQLFDKDLPDLQRMLGSRVPVARIKGRANYLCLRAFQKFESSPALLTERKRDLARFARWAATTQTGDRDEIGSRIPELDFFGALSASSENCIGRKCELYDDCHLTRIRAKAGKARIVIVNHRLLVADRVVRQNDYGAVLPDYDMVSVDEAHRLEIAGTQSFSVELTSSAAERLAKDARSFLRDADPGRRVPAALKRFQDSYRDIFDQLEPDPGKESRTLDPAEFSPELKSDRDACLAHLSGLNERIEEVRERAQGEKNDPVLEAANSMEKRIHELAADFRRRHEPAANRVFWSTRWRERGERKPMSSLKTAPVHPGTELNQSLFSEMRAAVLTSATLAVDGGFAHAADQLGVPSFAEATLPSPFDYRASARLFVPRNIPQPNDPGFVGAAARTISQLIEASRGRALVLFTSWRNLDQIGDLVENNCSWPILRQRPKGGHGGLLREFRKTPGAVLLGVRAFWEGVDLPGAALSLLVIDRLPFAPPRQPLQVARSARAEAETGISGFLSYSVPEAALTLKQGLGRLIRSESDRGLAAVLDPRLVTMSYGETLRQSLPDFPLTTDTEEAVAFLEALP